MNSAIAVEVQKRCSEFYQKNLVVGRTLPPKVGIDDDSLKFLLLDSNSRPCYFASCSTPTNPILTKRGAEKAEHIHSLLPETLGRHVLKADLVDYCGDLSYAVYPYCYPLPKSRIRRFVTKSILRKPLLSWLLNSTRETMVPIEDVDRDRTLRYLAQAQSKEVSSILSNYCREAQLKIESSSFRPYHTFCHNDLWEDNILLGSDKGLETDFKVIDWGGSAVEGYPIYDLLRLNGYLRLPKRRLNDVLTEYSQLLQCKPSDSVLYLTLSLAHLYENLEHFPLDKFNSLCINMFKLLDNSIDLD